MSYDTVDAAESITGQIYGVKWLLGELRNCKSSTASHLGFMSVVWCVISGGEPVQWGAIKGPSALI